MHSWLGVLLFGLLGLVADAIATIFVAVYAVLAAAVGILVLGSMKLVELV